jgi:GTP cyclohydrolase I
MTIEAPLADVQNQVDGRGVALDRVGVTGLYFPLTIREKAGGQQTITARLALTVALHEDQRGAHLSSLVEALHVYQERLFSMSDLIELVQVTGQARTRGGWRSIGPRSRFASSTSCRSPRRRRV